GKFEKDLERLRRRGKSLPKIEAIVEKLQTGMALEPRHRPHILSGDWAGFWELHIEPDWLLIYAIDGEAVYLVRTGTHSDLF
ncbi:MAG: type II toxin-antitoxin system YafQ family toxin, partial [Pseudomonadota bacterium]|nr:type II toxin-antitoxin system YafQ family toxin [Pseudomonadota bacterium]